MSAVPDFEIFDMSVLGADSHLWLSVQSRQGSVFGVSRSIPTLSVPQPYTSPVEWLGPQLGTQRWLIARKRAAASEPRRADALASADSQELVA